MNQCCNAECCLTISQTTDFSKLSIGELFAARSALLEAGKDNYQDSMDAFTLAMRTAGKYQGDGDFANALEAIKEYLAAKDTGYWLTKMIKECHFWLHVRMPYRAFKKAFLESDNE